MVAAMPRWFATRLLSVLALSGCGGDIPPYKPPIALSHDLQPGEYAHCENWFFILSLPVSDAPIILFRRHVFDCWISKF
jgi:hypothetical protein